MADCIHGYNGTATVERNPDGLRWTHADRYIHVSDELLNDPFLLGKYEIVGPCEGFDARAVHHAKLRDDDD